ncbi:unnamed protein product [Oncorhynchus mykiss]|uniref:G-protein coupled receptors family 2 profile 1 domain-containing protein n=1 Tax=Oncorhynchus mykiss TaxID=8022 RepID=A0A060X238_ONCMY|nr:unnamed protein product [Oncorhynchus mykiss]
MTWVYSSGKLLLSLNHITASQTHFPAPWSCVPLAINREACLTCCFDKSENKLSSFKKARSLALEIKKGKKEEYGDGWIRGLSRPTATTRAKTYGDRDLRGRLTNLLHLESITFHSTAVLHRLPPLFSRSPHPNIIIRHYRVVWLEVVVKTCALLNHRVLTIWAVVISGTTADLTCDTLLLLSTNLTARTLALWNLTLTPSNVTAGLFCNMSIDPIGTCWPKSTAGEWVLRPCPEMFYGVKYNTTNNVYRECLSNGSWAVKGNYTQCQEILNEKKSKLHYHIAVIINYMGHCISLAALLVAFILFMRLR